MPSPSSRERSRRRRAYALSWLAYASSYLGRKGLSVTKLAVRRALGVSEGALAAIDTAYLIAYACGQFPSGWIGDRVGPRRLVGWGLVAAALACAIFGAGHGALWLGGAFLVAGLAQAAGWPGTTGVMAAWTPVERRGAVMGIWGTNSQVGGVAATALASFLLARTGWRSAFWVPAIGMALVGALVLLALPMPDPTIAAQPAATDATDDTSATTDATATTATAAAATRAAGRAVLRSPIVWSYGACYFCLKLIRYSLLFWLPYYLATVVKLPEERAGYVATAFEVGGVLGSILVGRISDRVRAPRALVAIVAIVGLACALFLFGRVAPHGVLANVLCLGLVGALLFGPDTLLVGAAAQDVGGPAAASTATGTVNGIGSFGAVLQGAATVGVSRAFGWSALFYFFVALSLVGALCLVPALALTRGRRQRAR